VLTTLEERSMLATMSLLLLAASAGAPSAAEREALETQVTEVFGPYRNAAAGTASDFPIYSAEVAALIERWKAVRPQNEPDALSDGDWLCQCQDWNHRRFLTTIISIAMNVDGTAEVDLILDLGRSGSDAARVARLVFKREQDAWKVDDIVGDSLPEGLKHALRETIAAHEPQAAGTPG
jgi:hypothetical protein